MSSRIRIRIRSVLLPLLVMAMLIALAVPGVAAKPAKVSPGTMTVTDVDLLGFTTMASNQSYFGTEFGGLSGITYDQAKDVYYAVSDSKEDFRFYTLRIDPATADPTILDVSSVKDRRGHLPGSAAMDLEGVELLHNGQLFMSSERDVDDVPHMYRFNKNGKMNRELRVPSMFLPVKEAVWDADEGKWVDVIVYGARENLSFESLTSTPNGRYLYTATENALVQDGPVATLALTSPSRVLEYRAAGLMPAGQWVYVVDAIPVAGAFGVNDNGLVDMQAIDNAGTFLMLERSFALFYGNTIRLFEASTAGATDVSGYDSLGDVPGYVPMSKTFLVDFHVDLGMSLADIDNVEGMTFGPTLPDGRRLLVVVADDNFNKFGNQHNLFVTLAITLEAAN